MKIQILGTGCPRCKALSSNTEKAVKELGLYVEIEDELRQVLNLHPYFHASKIKEKLGPSLDELVEHGYLAGWNLDLTSHHAGHKIIFRHGEKFGGDQRKMIDSHSNPQVRQTLREEEQKLNSSLVEELVRRDIPERQAKKLLANIAEGQEVMDQLEWGDYWIRQNSSSKILNPPGFYIYLIKEDIRPPELFETSRKKAIFSQQQETREKELEKQAALELAFEDYRNQTLDSYIAENCPGDKYQALIERKKQKLSPQYRQFAFWKPEALMRFLETSVRADLEKGLSLHTFDSFCKKRNFARMAF